MQTAKFITLEGGEGVGKTTNLQVIEKLLRKHNIEFIVTHEPGGTPLAEKIRKVLLDHGDEIVAVDTELLLMFASRAQHIAEVIKPALAAGKWVLCSRFTDSTYAYQGGGRQIDKARIAELETWVHGDLQPDLTLYLDLPVEDGLNRAKLRGKLDRIEQESIEFFNRVRNSYLERVKKFDRFKLIDASKTVAEVGMEIEEVLAEFLIL